MQAKKTTTVYNIYIYVFFFICVCVMCIILEKKLCKSYMVWAIPYICLYMSLSIANVMYINLFRQPHLSHIQTSQFFHLPSLLRRMRAQLPPMLNSPTTASILRQRSFDKHWSCWVMLHIKRTYTIPQTRLPVRGSWDSFGLTLKLDQIGTYTHALH